jgi:hypothetical protein
MWCVANTDTNPYANTDATELQSHAIPVAEVLHCAQW